MTIDYPTGYHKIVVETYAIPNQERVSVRPIFGQVFGSELNVRCDASIRDTLLYPIGTRFNVRAKLSRMAGGELFLHSPHQWAVTLNTDAVEYLN